MSTSSEKLPRPRIDDERLEPLDLRARDLRAERRQADVLAAHDGLVAGIAPGLFDQAVRPQRPQRAVEVGGEDSIAAVALLNLADQAPAMALAVGKGQQHIQHERLQRQKT